MAKGPSVVLLAQFVLTIFLPSSWAVDYPVDDSTGLGRKFDGIGGLSGGGATSKLLINYPEPQRSHILDYLFKPNFGASLQILKVEIGGDSQSTDGTESSHMHEENDENYQRGYEWWLMVEAKKRNPDIKLYGLPWAFPGWIGQGRQYPYINPTKTATYIVKWVQGAKKYYNLTIDYLGSWNERNYNIDYNLVLRAALDSNGFSHIKLVTADGNWGVSKDVLKNASFARTVDIIGVHYPGTETTADALSTNKTLWSSEDYSTFNNNVGAGCWARILNQNYVNGHMTSTISWNLIAAYYNALPFQRSGLMTAVEPWGGHYVVQSPIWITAHTTQFVSLDWHYLPHQQGVGHLKYGGSYVSLISPDKKDFTIIMETMQHDHSICVRPHLPAYKVQPQNVTFVLKGSLASLKSLTMWHSKLGFDGAETTLMKHEADVQVVGGKVTVAIGVDEVITLSTVTTATKGAHPAPPASKPFPLPYQDNFEAYPLYSEAYNFVPQIGVWEVRDSNDSVHGKVNAQVILHRPVDWCNANPVIKNKYVTINLGGDFNWVNISLQADIYLSGDNTSAEGAFLGVRVHMKKGSCKMADTKGIYLYVNPKEGLLAVASDMEMKNLVFKSIPMVAYGQWFTAGLQIQGNQVLTHINGKPRIEIIMDSPTPNGFVAYGTHGFGNAYFDNVVINGV